MSRPGALENFFFDDIHFALADETRKLAREACGPVRDRFERGDLGEDAAAREFVKILGTAGLVELCVPAEYGGRHDALDLRSICVVRENLSYESGFADTCFILQGLGSYPIALAGREDLARAWLPRIAAGKAIAAFAVTEPNAGSDLANTATRARRDGDDFVVDGEKIFISNAGVADFYTLLARTGNEPGHRGLSMILVPADRPGISVERQRVLGPHPIGKVRFSGVRVPASNALTVEGEGLRLALANLDVFRTSVGAAACGLALRALDDAIAHTKARVQFGKPLADQQLTRAALADMATSLEAARLLVYRAAAAHDRGSSRLTKAVSMAKLFATEAAQQVIDRAVQLHGGLGVTAGNPVERLYREVRALRIYEGTSEIQKLVIAKALLDP
jgi:acyl-CoA dehydrogenase